MTVRVFGADEGGDVEGAEVEDVMAVDAGRPSRIALRDSGNLDA